MLRPSTLDGFPLTSGCALSIDDLEQDEPLAHTHLGEFGGRYDGLPAAHVRGHGQFCPP
jgi:hypothetical protein